MFLIKSLDELLKVSGATLEGTVPRVAQLEADVQGVSTTYRDVAGDMEAERGAGAVEHNDGNVCSQSWYGLKTHLGRLHEGSVVYNTALICACSYGQMTVQARLRVEHWGTVGEGSVVY